MIVALSSQPNQLDLRQTDEGADRVFLFSKLVWVFGQPLSLAFLFVLLAADRRPDPLAGDQPAVDRPAHA
jgi:hypothetical protein